MSTSSFSALVIKALLIILVVFGLQFGLFGLRFPFEQINYTAASLDKRQLLENHAAGSILLVGGSNLVFGMDSAHLREVTGKPVINTALHAGLGLRYMINSVLPHVKENDVVVLSLEYRHYDSSPDVWRSDMLRRVVGVDFWGNLPYITTAGQWYTISRYHPQYTLESLWFTATDGTIECPGDTYCRASFNEWGDIKSEFNTRNPDSQRVLQRELNRERSSGYGRPLDTDAINLLNHFGEEVRKRNATVFLVFPPLPDSIMARDSEGINKTVADVKNVVEIPALNEPLSYNDALFYDTIYHLNSEGRSIHSAYIADLLQTEMLNPVTMPEIENHPQN